jgi:hypothetical protein
VDDFSLNSIAPAEGKQRHGMHVAPAHLLSTCLFIIVIIGDEATRMRGDHGFERYEFMYVLQP